ncbi:MAG: hypothetical protein NC548_45265 [Lachnospiraceae bacterium]|nr:hypothetical protein [Lachnospiraceae bacterium]
MNNPQKGWAAELTPLQFIQQFYGANEDDVCFTVSYRPYEYGRHIESMPLDKAIEKLQKDIDEMREFMAAFGVEEFAKEATFNIWLKHLVRFS